MKASRPGCWPASTPMPRRPRGPRVRADDRRRPRSAASRRRSRSATAGERRAMRPQPAGRIGCWQGLGMTGLLKSGSAGISDAPGAAVRARRPPPALPDPEMDALRERLPALETELAERDDGIAGLIEKSAAAFAKGRGRGRGRSRSSAASERRESWRAAGRAPRVPSPRRWRRMERLAALLAETASSACSAMRRRGRPRQRPDPRARSTSSRRRRGPRSRSRPRISARRGRRPSARHPACRDHRSAGARLRRLHDPLRLGTLEVGIGQQWGALRAALEEMAGA